MEIEDFEINIMEDGRIIINYIGDDKRIDKCNSILDPKFPTNHLIRILLNKLGIK